MKPGDLNEQMLRAMSPEDRAALQVQTQAEAEASYEAKTERDLHDGLMRWLNHKELLYTHAAMFRKVRDLRRGWPDFEIFLPAIFTDNTFTTFSVPAKVIFIEFKIEGCKPRPEQAQMIERLTRDGFAVLVATSVTQAIEFVREQGGI